MIINGHSIEMTAEEVALMDKYTVAVRVNPDDPEEEYRAGLRIGHQSFLLKVTGDWEYISWHRVMLARALAQLVRLEKVQ